MASMHISLPDPMRDWVEQQTKSGRYDNASEYIRDLIRHHQDAGTQAPPDTRQAYDLTQDTLPDEIMEEFEKGYQGPDTPHLDHLLK